MLHINGAAGRANLTLELIGTALPDYVHRDRIETTLAAGVEIA